MVRQYLKKNYTPADRVLFSSPMLFTLLYFYNAEEGAQWPQLRELTVDKARPESRTFVVVNLTTGQSVASVLEDNGTSLACYSEPRVARRFRYATVYLLRPRPCASPTANQD